MDKRLTNDPMLEPLHGLIIFNSLRKMKTGATRSLRLAAELLGSLGVHLHFCASRSIFHFFSGYFQENRFRYDFIIFNGLASIGPKSNFSHHIWRIARLLETPIFIYWHESEWVFKRLKENHKHFQRVAEISQHPSGIHLTASRACSSSINNNLCVSNLVEIFECSRIPFSDAQLELPTNPPTVINLASIQERKGTDLFVETAIQVCKNHPTVKFIWLGDGKSFGDWQHKIKDSEYENRILFPGYIDSPFSLLQKASVFFLSSRDDPFPLSIIEAMAYGRTIVAFNVGGAPEALGNLGYLIKPFDTEVAALRILECLQEPPEKLIKYKLKKRYLDLYTPEEFAFRLNGIIREQLFNLKNERL